MTIDDIQALPFHLRVTIPKDYLDIFEHMNVQYYLKIFNDSVFHMCADLDMTAEFFAENHNGIYAVDQRLSYRAEVKAGDTVAVYSRLIARSAKSLHFKVFMINETKEVLSATMEALAFHVDRNTKRSAPFLEITQKALDVRLKQEQTLEWDAQLTDKIRINGIL